MKKRKLLYSMTMLGTLGLPALSAVSCGSDAVELDPAKKDSVIQMVGKIGWKDKGFNEGAYNGAQKALKEIAGLKHFSEYRVPDSKTPSAKKGVDEALKAGTYIVLGVGFQYFGFINNEDYAGKFKNREFIAIDGHISGKVKPNVIGVNFQAHKAAFLTGVLTGIYLAKNYDTYSENGGLKVGAFGGGAHPPVKDMISGFLHGLAYYNEKLAKDENHKVTFVGWNGEENGFTGTYSPNAKSIQTSKKILSDNIDVVFPVAGGQVTSMVDTIKGQSAKKTKIVGVDSDQSKVFGEDGKHFITSAMKNTEIGAYESLKAIYRVEEDENAKIRKGQNNVVGLQGGFVGIAKGVFGKDKYKGTALASTIKGNGGIDTSSDKTLYEQLTNPNNKIFKYAEGRTSNDWEAAKTIFGFNGDKKPVLNVFDKSK